MGSYSWREEVLLEIPKLHELKRDLVPIEESNSNSSDDDSSVKNKKKKKKNKSSDDSGNE